MKQLPEFFVGIFDCQPNEYDLEPPIGRHEAKTHRLLWDCTRRIGNYNSIDIRNLLNSRGRLFKVKKLLKWNSKAFVFKNWMKYTLDLKEEGEQANKKEQGSGNAKRTFAKTLGNATYGDTIKQDHDDHIAFINHREDQQDFLRDNFLKNISQLRSCKG